MSRSLLADRLTVLRTAFLKELCENRAELTSLLLQTGQAAPTGDAGKRLLALTHSLAGRAGIFGFPNLSDTAAGVHDLLETNGRDLRDAALTLISALTLVLDPPPRA